MAERDLKEVRRCTDKVEQARARLREAILKAHRSGESLRGIAPYAGMSHQRVAELLKEAEEDEERRSRPTG